MALRSHWLMGIEAVREADTARDGHRGVRYPFRGPCRDGRWPAAVRAFV